MPETTTEGETGIIGGDWAARYPGRFDAAHVALPSDDGVPCPVCGHPTGDCTGHEETDMAASTRRAATDAARKSAEPARDPGTGVPARKDAPADAPAAPPVDAAPATDAATATVRAAPAPEESAELAGLPDAQVIAAAFMPAGDGQLFATREVEVSFLPHNAGTTRSRVLAFPKGQTFTEKRVATKLASYRVRDQARIHYRD